MEALRRGDSGAARELFERAIAAGAADADTWFGLSRALQGLGERAQEDSALEKVLQINSAHLPALIRKGDLYTLSGDRRAATSYYQAALRLARTIQRLPSEWEGELKRIEALCQQNVQAYEQHLLTDLTAQGLGQPGSERFSRAVELLLGKRRIYHQQPRMFHFPELPEIEIFDCSQFPWIPALEEATPLIQEELKGVLASGAGIVPYIQKEADRPAVHKNRLHEDPSWSAFHLLRHGAPVEANAARCPKTMAALAQVPLCTVKGRTPTALFSLLRPGAYLAPHHGYLNTRLICHLPLIVPGQCELRVGNQIHVWREGEVLVFDDTIEHEAWNRSSQLRVVLLFDIWRPELTPMERSLVSEMLESIDRLGASRREWTQ